MSSSAGGCGWKLKLEQWAESSGRVSSKSKSVLEKNHGKDLRLAGCSGCV